MTAQPRRLVSGIHQATAYLIDDRPLYLDDENPEIDITSLTAAVTARAWGEANSILHGQGRNVAPVEMGAALVWSEIRRRLPGTSWAEMSYETFAGRCIDVAYRRYELLEDDPLLDPPEPGAP